MTCSFTLLYIPETSTPRDAFYLFTFLFNIYHRAVIKCLEFFSYWQYLFLGILFCFHRQSFHEYSWACPLAYVFKFLQGNAEDKLLGYTMSTSSILDDGKWFFKMIVQICGPISSLCCLISSFKLYISWYFLPIWWWNFILLQFFITICQLFFSTFLMEDIHTSSWKCLSDYSDH